MTALTSNRESAQGKEAGDAKISVVIPVYNVEPYLRRCLESLRKQTFREFDAVLVDDGSTDAGGKICDEFAARDKRFHVIHTTNNGPSAARNRGMEWALTCSRSEALAFIDSDDWIATDYLDALWEGLSRGRKEGCSCCCIMFMREEFSQDTPKQSGNYGWKRVSAEDYWVIPDALPDSPCAKLFDKALFADQRMRFPRGKWYEDTFLVYRLVFKTDIIFSSRKLYGYTSREGSTTHSSDFRRLYDYVAALTEQEAFFEEKGKRKALRLTRERLAVVIRPLVRNCHDEGLRGRLRSLLRELRPDFLGKIQNKRVASLYREAWPVRYALFGHLPFVKRSVKLVNWIFK